MTTTRRTTASVLSVSSWARGEQRPRLAAQLASQLRQTAPSMISRMTPSSHPAHRCLVAAGVVLDACVPLGVVPVRTPPARRTVRLPSFGDDPFATQRPSTATCPAAQMTRRTHTTLRVQGWGRDGTRRSTTPTRHLSQPVPPFANNVLRPVGEGLCNVYPVLMKVHFSLIACFEENGKEGLERFSLLKSRS